MLDVTLGEILIIMFDVRLVDILIIMADTSLGETLIIKVMWKYTRMVCGIIYLSPTDTNIYALFHYFYPGIFIKNLDVSESFTL